jgi:hypothetical protein
MKTKNGNEELEVYEYYTITGERIDRRIDDGDDGNSISSNVHNRVTFSATHSDFDVKR